MTTHPFDCFPDSPAKARAVLRHQTMRENLDDVRICFSGEIDLSNSDQVDTAVTEALRSHLRRLDVDLAEVRFIDSSGIHALMRCRTRAIEAGCSFAVGNAQPMIYRVLEVSGVVEALAVTRCPGKKVSPERV